jgi:hypothetical protein
MSIPSSLLSFLAFQIFQIFAPLHPLMSGKMLSTLEQIIWHLYQYLAHFIEK